MWVDEEMDDGLCGWVKGLIDGGIVDEWMVDVQWTN